MQLVKLVDCIFYVYTSDESVQSLSINYSLHNIKSETITRIHSKVMRCEIPIYVIMEVRI